MAYNNQFSALVEDDPDDEDPLKTDPVDFPTKVVNRPEQGTPPPPIVPKRGGGGGNTNAVSLSFPSYDFGVLPAFDAPEFVAPTAQSVLDSPDYQARLRSGTDALERSAAARGVLRTGGTLKDIIDYGKKFGQGEYDSSFNHALQGYQANYQRLHDIFAPKLAGWQANAQAALAKALAIYGRYTQWNAPNQGGGGGRIIPAFQANPYGTSKEEEDKRRRNLATGFGGYSFAA